MAARKKCATAAALREAVGHYFARISRIVPVREAYETGEKDQYGHAVMKNRPVYNMLDEPATRIEWFEPPSVGGLCVYLGISRETWSNYGAPDSKLREVVEEARGKIEAYWEGQLAREGRTQGIQFNLSHNFGWKARGEVSLDRDTREALSGKPVSLEEKLALIREMAEKGAAPAGEENEERSPRE